MKFSSQFRIHVLLAYLLAVIAPTTLFAETSNVDSQTPSTREPLTIGNLQAQFDALEEKTETQQISRETIDRLNNQVADLKERLETVNGKLELTQWQWGFVGFIVGLVVGVGSLRLPTIQRALGLSSIKSLSSHQGQNLSEPTSVTKQDSRTTAEIQWERTRNRYVRKEIYPDTWVYVSKTENDGRQLCTKCFESDHKEITLQKINSAYMECPSCKNNYRIGTMKYVLR